MLVQFILKNICPYFSESYLKRLIFIIVTEITLGGAVLDLKEKSVDEFFLALKIDVKGAGAYARLLCNFVHGKTSQALFGYQLQRGIVNLF